MKATLRKNGLMMLTIKVDFNVDRERIILAVMLEMLRGGAEPKGRNGVIAIAQAACFNNGWWMAGEGDISEDIYGEEESTKAKNRAAAIVDKFLPDLITAKPPNAAAIP